MFLSSTLISIVQRFLTPALCFISTIVLSAPDLLAYKEATHEELNKEATLHSSSDAYLKTQLNFPSGVNQKVSGQSILRWIQDGGRLEDAGFRFLNHFHNPLQPDWTRAGLSDSLPLGESAILWAQGPQGFSWVSARQSFFTALTAPSKDERDSAFADTFRALGQVMHLLQDASVPAHSRNDNHLLSTGCFFPEYECFVEEFQEENPSAFASLVGSPFTPASSLLQFPPNPLAPIPIARLVDSDQYTGIDPGVTIGPEIGLSEYTDANFFSDDTLFTEFFTPDDPHHFPFPNASETVLFRDPDNKRLYFARVNTAGQPIQHLAVIGWFHTFLTDFVPQGSFFPDVALDEACYKDYAKHLIPRAVGYSAGLLNSFFRGQLEAVAEGADKIKITNTSSEPMSGDFSLYYDAQDGTRKLTGGPHALSLNPSETSTPQFFTVPEDAAKPGTYILVFRGALGQEADAVAAKVVVLEAAVAGFLEDFEGASAFFSVQVFIDGSTANLVTQGQNTFTTRNGTWTITCFGPLNPGTPFGTEPVGIPDGRHGVITVTGMGTNPTTVYKHFFEQPLQGSTIAVSCDTMLTTIMLGEKVPLSSFPFLQAEFFFSQPSGIASFPPSTYSISVFAITDKILPSSFPFRVGFFGEGGFVRPGFPTTFPLETWFTDTLDIRAQARRVFSETDVQRMNVVGIEIQTSGTLISSLASGASGFVAIDNIKLSAE